MEGVRLDGRAVDSLPPGAAATARERSIEIVEQCGAPRKALLVVLRIVGDPGDQSPEALSLWAPELAVLEIDVVHDLGDGHKRTVLLEAGPADEHLERAAVAFVGELGLEHVKAKLT